MTVELEARQVTKRYGGLAAVDGVDLVLERGKIVGLIGPNGSGKSTLIDVLSGLQRLDAGEVLMRGRTLTGLPAYRVARLGLVRTFQLTRVFQNLSVWDNLLAVRASKERAEELLSFLHVRDVHDQPAGSLSYGQQKLVELASVLMLEPSVILLDEPGAGINPALLEVIGGILRALRERGAAILLVEHNIELIVDLCDWLVALDAGRVIAAGVPNTVLADPNVHEAYLGK